MQMQAREGQRVFSRQHGGGYKRPDSELFRITAASFCFLFFTLCFHLDDVESVGVSTPGIYAAVQEISIEAIYSQTLNPHCTTTSPGALVEAWSR